MFPKILMKILARIKKCLILLIIQLSDNSKKLLVNNMKDETCGASTRICWIEFQDGFLFGR